MSYDTPKMFDTQLLGCRGDRWYWLKDDWLDVQAALSSAVQASTAMIGFTYTPTMDTDTSKFELMMNSNDGIWKCEIRCYSIGPFHRTLKGMDAAATIAVQVRTFAYIDTQGDRLKAIGGVVKRASLVPWSV